MPRSIQTIAATRAGILVGVATAALAVGCAKKQPPALSEVVAD